MSTVANLVEYLLTLEQDQPIIYQFILEEHTDLYPEQFEQVADYLMDSSGFNDAMSETMREWVKEALEEIEER